jgi:uncharacterized protein YecE (DUF72 family)
VAQGEGARLCRAAPDRHRDQRHFYSSQKPASFAKWRDAVPDGFMFTVKANLFCVNRRVLADAGESIARFTSQGITELGAKLGPILWQLAATKKFDAEDIVAFLQLMPAEQEVAATPRDRAAA